MSDPLIDPTAIHPATGLPVGTVTLGPTPAQVTLADGGPQRIVQIAAWPDTAAAVSRRLREAVGVAPPALANRWTGSGDGVRLIWNGPYRWWLVGTDPARTDAVMAALPPDQAAVTEQGAGRSVLRATGPNVRDLLAKLCPLDLHPGVFPADGAAGTVVHHVSVRLVAAETGQAVELWLPRSSAPSTLAVLLRAGAEYGVTYAPHSSF